MSHNSPTPNPEAVPGPSGPPQTHTAPREAVDWPRIAGILHVAKRSAALPDPEEYTLVPEPAQPRTPAQEFEDDLRRRLVHRAAKMALVACMDGDDADATDHIDSLTDEQIKTVQDAAVALSLHASRLRKARENGHDHAPDDPVLPGTDDAIRDAMDATARAKKAEQNLRTTHDAVRALAERWQGPDFQPAYAHSLITVLENPEGYLQLISTLAPKETP